MLKKKRFKPVITRVELNPEQAVLTCPCYTTGRAGDSGTNQYAQNNYCKVSGYNNKTRDSNSIHYVLGGTFS